MNFVAYMYSDEDEPRRAIMLRQLRAYAMEYQSEGSIAKGKKGKFSQNKYHPTHSYHITWT